MKKKKLIQSTKHKIKVGVERCMWNLVIEGITRCLFLLFLVNCKSTL